jgi:GNAT superfamily N-acetyltransferase
MKRAAFLCHLVSNGGNKAMAFVLFRKGFQESEMIRPIREEDIQATVALTWRCMEEVISDHHSPAVVDRFRNEVTSDWLRRQMAWKDILVAQENAIVATGGIADFGSSESPKICVSQFYVNPDLHRRGIGKRLMEHLIRSVHDRHVPVLHVPSTRNAIPFYQSFGFVIDSIQPDSADEITWMTMDLRSPESLKSA